MGLPQNLHHTPLQCEQLEDRVALTATSFVDGMYRNVLFRAEPTTSPYFQQWVGVAGNVGSAGRSTTFNGFWSSAEHRAVQTNAYYRSFLHRAPENQSAINFWINRFAAGESEQDVKRDFLTSGEYINAHPTPTAYIQGLYLDVLGRLPSDAETGYWLTTMSQIGYVNVAVRFLTSKEYFTIVLNHVYQDYLNRQIDNNGYAFFINALSTGQAKVRDVAMDILTSTEYDNIPAGPPTATPPNAHNINTNDLYFAL